MNLWRSNMSLNQTVKAIAAIKMWNSSCFRGILCSNCDDLCFCYANNAVLSVEQTVSYNGSYALRYACCLFRINYKDTSVGYCFLIPCIINDSLISVALYNFCRRIDRRMCVINYVTIVCTCNLNYKSTSVVNAM
jgi:hypothetical protein